jgi:hypothetical protein
LHATETYSVPSAAKADVVFIIDSTPTMYLTILDLPKRLSGLLAAWQNLDWQVGVMNADPVATNPRASGGRLMAMNPYPLEIGAPTILNSRTPWPDYIFNRNINFQGNYVPNVDGPNFCDSQPYCQWSSSQAGKTNGIFASAPRERALWHPSAPAGSHASLTLLPEPPAQLASGWTHTVGRGRGGLTGGRRGEGRLEESQRQGIIGNIAVLGHHHGHRLPHIPDFPPGQHRVCRDPHPLEVARVPWRDIAHRVHEVVCRQHREHGLEGSDNTPFYRVGHLLPHQPAVVKFDRFFC